jgi:hypothetical protein
MGHGHSATKHKNVSRMPHTWKDSLKDPLVGFYDRLSGINLRIHIKKVLVNETLAHLFKKDGIISLTQYTLVLFLWYMNYYTFQNHF